MTVCSVKVPFRSVRSDAQRGAQFDVSYDVVEGEMPFLIVLPALKAMRSTVNFEYMKISLRINGEYRRLALVEDNDHIHLPFVCQDATPPKRTQDAGKGAGDAN